MDYFLTTYRKDYKWPVALTVEDNKKIENERKVMETHMQDADPHINKFREPVVKSDVEFGKVVPAQTGASPQGEATKYNQPNAYLQKLYRKYPYLYNIMKFTTSDDMVKRVMSEKYKTTYQTEYNKEDDFSTLVNVVKQDGPIPTVDLPKTNVCLPEGIEQPKCKCIKDLSFTPCQCAKEVPVRRIAWKPAPISKMPQMPREKKNRDDVEDTPKLAGSGAVTAINPFTSEYVDTFSKIGSLIIKNKLLYKTVEATEEKKK